MIRLIALINIFLTTPALAVPGSADIFTADYSNNLGNWTAIGDDTHRTQSRIAGVGPHGLDAFEVERLPVNRPDHYSGYNVLVSPFSAGTSRFFRWYEWHSPNNNYFNSIENGISGLRGALRHKRLLIGNGQAAGQRMILNVNAEENTALPHIEIIFDGSPVQRTTTFQLNTWTAIQVEVKYGPNAFIKVWLNNDNYGLPDAQLSGVGTYTQTDTDFVSFGMYTNNGLPVGGVHTWRDAGFRISSSFDPHWHNWMENGDSLALPSAPQNLRVQP